ncbi:MAG: ATP-binding cassette domain-containing protein, partial [Hyphomicrobiaceae bacterium]
PGSLSTLSRTFVGKVTVQDAGLRYTAKTEPALRGVSLRAEAGELIAITGPSGAGKSTLLKIIGGLHQAQIGAVCIDDLDIRQFDVADVRQSIGYVPQKLHMFYGTIAQNIRLAQPTASQDDTEAALEQVGALEEIRQLPDGVNTRIFGINENRLSSGLLKQISLARAFIKRAPIYLLDEPGSDLDRRSDAKFIELLKTLKGKATIILVTHRPSHLWLADRVIVLNNGRVAANAPPEKIVPSLFGTPSPAGKTAAQASANTESTSKHQDQPTPQLPREGA